MEMRGCSDVKKGPQARECRWPLEAEKARKPILPPKPLAGPSPANTLILGFRPPELYGNTFLLFLALRFVVILV